MRLRIALGVCLLAILLWHLVRDSQFRSEFFTLSGQTLFICAAICAFILPDKLAWPFMAALAAYWAYALIFLRDQGVAPGSDTIPGIVLVIVFSLLAHRTFKAGWRTRTNSLEDVSGSP